MKAMILAAGLGTRLRPLTNDRPKALVEVGGRTLLDITISRLRSFGVSEAIINVHHFADMIVAYLHAHDSFGIKIQISREQELLDTGGGLKKAAWFFGGSTEPFILHNVDVISTIDFTRMLRAHAETGALATVAVMDRKSSRYLLFDDCMQLCGRRSEKDHKLEIARPAADTLPLAFCGVHIISPRLLTMISEEGAFSIIATYLRLAAAGEKICAFRADEYQWRDLGTPESIRLAAELVP